MKTKVILIGGFSEIIELCELCNYDIIGIIDNNLKKSYMDYEIIGDDKSAEKIYKSHKNIKLIVTPDLPKTRKIIVQYYSKIGFKFCSLISIMLLEMSDRMIILYP